MNLNELLTGGGLLLVLAALVQISPLQLNPWSAIAKMIGRAINVDVLKDLEEVKTGQRETRRKLEEHIRVDDERNADLHRIRILQFNTELLREQRHTKEEFHEILYNIDCYEKYCAENPAYQNNRAVHAVKNIKRVYDMLLETHDFL